MPSAIGKSATLALSAQNQTLDSIHHIIASIAGRGGCEKCGRIALLKIDFVVDPGPELGKQGVISQHLEGF